MPRRLLCLLAAASLAMFPAAARAQPASKSKVQAAKSYVDAGLAAQRTGDYDTAILLYKKAYELVPHPVLLFNMAQAHRLAGRVEQALALYRRYLKVDPRGREARTARELVAELEASPSADTERAADTGGSDGDPAADGSHKATGRSDEGSGTRADPARRVAEGTDTGADAPADKARADTTAAPPPSPPGAAPDVDQARRAEPPVRRVAAVTPRARLDVGASLADRRLSYDTRSGFLQVPFRPDSSAGALRIEGEVYPLALADPDRALAGLGVALAYDKTFGLDLPTDQGPAPVDQSHVRIGARFRAGLGEAWVVSAGVDYARRRFVIDRSGLTGRLDMPMSTTRRSTPRSVFRSR